MAIIAEDTDLTIEITPAASKHAEHSTVSFDIVARPAQDVLEFLEYRTEPENPPRYSRRDS